MTRTMLDTGTEDLKAWEGEGILHITLNRPQARNAMSGPMNQAFGKMLAYGEESASVRVIVVTGAEGAFCAGGDVKGMAGSGDGGSTAAAEATLDERIHAQRLNQRATAGRMYLMPKPVIASLPGAAAGAGMSLALAADLRIMAENAFITSAFAKVGFSGDYGGTFFLTQLVGSGEGAGDLLPVRSSRCAGMPPFGPRERGGAGGGAGGRDLGAGAAPCCRSPGGLPLYEGEPQSRRRGRRCPELHGS